MALKQRKRLGDLLVDAKLISEKQLQKALVAKKTNEKLGHYLVEQQLITEEQLADTLEIQLGIQRVQLNRYTCIPKTSAPINRKPFFEHFEWSKPLIILVKGMDKRLLMVKSKLIPMLILLIYC